MKHDVPFSNAEVDERRTIRSGIHAGQQSDAPRACHFNEGLGRARGLDNPLERPWIPIALVLSYSSSITL